MTCQELKDMFELYSLGILEPDEKSEIDAHLRRGCPECRRNFQDALALNAVMLAAAPDVAPSSKLKRRVLASVGVERTGFGWTAALAAAAMLVVALWLSVQEQRKESQLADARRTIKSISVERDRMNQALNVLDEPDAVQLSFGKSDPAPPRGNVFLHARRGVVLVSTNLPALAVGETYEMWVIPKGAAPRPAGLFQADFNGSAVNVLAGPIEISTLDAVAVTVEPESGSAAPTTKPVIHAPIAGM
jgi:anti-sigma-K factor RskA